MLLALRVKEAMKQGNKQTLECTWPTAGLQSSEHWVEVEVRNRFKGLDLIDRVPDELWMEDHGIAWGTGSNTIPKKKKWKKKTKWLSEEALQIAEKRREVKGKGEKE